MNVLGILLLIAAIPIAILFSNFVVKDAMKPKAGRIFGVFFAVVVAGLGVLIVYNLSDAIKTGDTLIFCKFCSTHVLKETRPIIFWFSIAAWFGAGACLIGGGIGLVRHVFNSQWRAP